MEGVSRRENWTPLATMPTPKATDREVLLLYFILKALFISKIFNFLS